MDSTTLYPQSRRSYPPSSPHLGLVGLRLNLHPRFKEYIFSSANARAQLLTVPPYAVAAVILLSLSYASDKLQSRGIFMSIACALGGIGYLYVYFLELISLFGGSCFCDVRLLLTVANNNHVRYFATFCIVSGTYTTIGLTIAWCKSFSLLFFFRLMHYW